MANIVVARDTCVVGHKGERVRLVRGSAWDAADPFVKANPHLFSTEDRFIHRTEAPAERKVERATRRPGEKRG